MTVQNTAPMAQPASQGLAQSLSKAGTALGIVILLWSLVPLFGAEHFEAISYSTVNLSLGHFGEGIFSQNPRQPIVPEFIFATRSGVVVLIRALSVLTGDATAAFRLLVALSTLGLIAALWRCARAWAPQPVPLWCYVWAVILTPGLVELGYNLNDNVVAAAGAAIAVALIVRRSDEPAPELWWYLIAGLVAAAAVSVRFEAAMVAPILLLIILRHNRNVRAVGSAIGLCFVGGVIGLAMNALITGYSLWAVFHVISTFGVPSRFLGDAVFQRVAVVGISVGFPTLITVLMSTKSMSHRFRDWNMLALLAYGLGLVAVAVSIAPIPRYIYPIAYIVMVPAMIAGMTRVRPMIWAGVAGLYLLVPGTVILLDGPHLLIGKLYEPYYAILWQRGIDKNAQRLDSVLEAAENGTGPKTLLTGHFNSEYLYKYILRKDGYHEMPLDGTSCDAVARYTNDRDTINVIPVDMTYDRYSLTYELLWALSVLESAQCPSVDWSRAVTEYQFYGHYNISLDLVQSKSHYPFENPDYKQIIVPRVLNQDEIAERRKLACELVTERFGACGPDIVHREYQKYIKSYAR